MRSTSCVGFARQESDDNAIRDATMILKFRHLLETHELTSVLFDELKRVSGREKALDAGWQHSRRMPSFMRRHRPTGGSRKAALSCFRILS